MRPRSVRRHRRRGPARTAAALASLMVAAACSSAPDTVATIDGLEIERTRLESLHPEGYEPVPDEVASSLLLVMIHDVFLAAAESEFGITPDAAAVEAAFARRTDGLSQLGPLEVGLANRGQTAGRVRLEAQLDVLRDAVGPELVRREVPGFDLDAAYRDYLLEEAHVCVRQIRLAETAEIEGILTRLSGGEVFADLAREFSTDALAHRPEGESGAGGDMGCSYPNSFGLGLAEAALDTDIPVGEAFGPVIGTAGLHVVVVYEREIPDLDAVREQVVESATEVQGPDLFNAWAFEILRQADVTIEAAYGSWAPREGTGDVPTVIPASG